MLKKNDEKASLRFEHYEKIVRVMQAHTHTHTRGDRERNNSSELKE